MIRGIGQARNTEEMLIFRRNYLRDLEEKDEEKTLELITLIQEQQYYQKDVFEQQIEEIDTILKEREEIETISQRHKRRLEEFNQQEQQRKRNRFF